MRARIPVGSGGPFTRTGATSLLSISAASSSAFMPMAEHLHGLDGEPLRPTSYYLNEAAALLDERGFYGQDYEDDKGRIGLTTAVSLVLFGKTPAKTHREEDLLLDRVLEPVALVLAIHVVELTDWEGRIGRTHAEAVAALRSGANLSAREGQPSLGLDRGL